MAKTTIRQDTCNYCTRPANTQIMANNAVYCGKLCAAFGLIAEVHKEDGIVGDLVNIWATDTIEGICYEGPKSDIPGGIDVPVKVRWSQAADVEELHASAPKGINYFVVSIDDKGTPDWEPAEPGPFQLALERAARAKKRRSESARKAAQARRLGSRAGA
jgi:hypothetical protein